MYRIEVKAGEETVFRTIEELATGIRNGFITPRARIYHAASQKWLPIEFHPHYKKALDGNFTPTVSGPQPSLAAMPAPTFAFPSATPAPQPAEAAAVVMPQPAAAAPASVAPERASASLATPPAPAPAPRVDPWHQAVTRTAAESPVMAMHAAVSRPLVSEPEAEPGPIERYSPVAVREPPRAAPALPPEVVLPNITYPELPPMEHPEPRATARRSRRTAGRPLLLVGSAAVLVFAGQRVIASHLAAGGDPAAAAEAVAPSETPQSRAGADAPSAGPAPARPAVAPARAQPLSRPPSQPMTPGPAFAASVPARSTPGSAATAAAPAPIAGPLAAETHAAPRPDSAAIAPVPTAIELDVPALPPGESIAPALDQARDSLALKRILKAVTGRKADPTTP